MESLGKYIVAHVSHLWELIGMEGTLNNINNNPYDFILKWGAFCGFMLAIIQVGAILVVVLAHNVLYLVPLYRLWHVKRAARGALVARVRRADNEDEKVQALLDQECARLQKEGGWRLWIPAIC